MLACVPWHAINSFKFLAGLESSPVAQTEALESVEDMVVFSDQGVELRICTCDVKEVNCTELRYGALEKLVLGEDVKESRHDELVSWC
jgi:hypothetical protein